MNELKIKQEAFELKKRFGYSETEPIRIKSLLLKEKILTYFTPLDDDFSGMAVKIGELKFILVNASHPLGRQHFTICHELFHLYVDKNFSTHKCQTAQFDKSNRNEYDADSFASHFLLPEPGILGMIPDDEWGKNKIKLTTIVKIEQYYACSRRALANRLLFLQRITKDRRDEFCKGVKNSARLMGYPVNLYESGNEGEIWGDYGALAKNLFDADKISEGHYAALMNEIGVDIFGNTANHDD
jgi:Zn-dependent peptidase ImmA (M78 family)